MSDSELSGAEVTRLLQLLSVDCAVVTAGGAAAALAATRSAAKGVDVDCTIAVLGVAEVGAACGATRLALLRLNEEAGRLAYISPGAGAGVIR